MAESQSLGPYTLVLDDETRTISFTGIGRGTTEDTLRLIAEATAYLRAHPAYNMLYDSRQMEIASSPQAMIQVADALFQDKTLRYGKFAVVVPESREALARIFTALANDNGVVANVFTNLSEAHRWLRGEQR